VKNLPLQQYIIAKSSIWWAFLIVSLIPFLKHTPTAPTLEIALPKWLARFDESDLKTLPRNWADLNSYASADDSFLHDRSNIATHFYHIIRCKQKLRIFASSGPEVSEEELSFHFAKLFLDLVYKKRNRVFWFSSVGLVIIYSHRPICTEKFLKLICKDKLIQISFRPLWGCKKKDYLNQNGKQDSQQHWWYTEPDQPHFMPQMMKINLSNSQPPPL
jgi:hypothetical protein